MFGNGRFFYVNTDQSDKLIVFRKIWDRVCLVEPGALTLQDRPVLTVTFISDQPISALDIFFFCEPFPSL
jgi:hypothetical protein